MQASIRRFELELAERGVSPQRTARLVDELVDHFHSVEQELRDEGQSEDASERTARERMGDLDALAKLILSDERCIGFVRRRPRTAFLVGPIAAAVIVLCAYAVVALALAVVAIDALGLRLSDPIFHILATALYLPTEYVLPPLVAIGFCYAAQQHRCAPGWSLAACIVLSLLGGACYVGFHLPLPSYEGSVAVGRDLASRIPRVVLPLVVYVAFEMVRRFRTPMSVAS